MASSSLCSKAAFDLCIPTQIRQTESRRASAAGFASCTSNIVPQAQRPRKHVARRVTVSAETLGASAAYGGSARRWRVAESLPRRTTRRTCVTASKEGSEVVLEWKGEAETVLLTGSFLNWEKQLPLEKAGDGVFKVKYTLPPGAHQYKFLVDGQWQHRSDVETVSDGIGGVNNQVVVKEEQAAEKAPAAGGENTKGADSQPSTPTPEELQAIAEKAPPPGEDPEPIEKTVAKVMGRDDKKEAPKDKDDAKPAAKKAEAGDAASQPAAKKVEAEPKPAAKPVAKAAKKVAAPAAKEGDNGAPTADAAPTPKAKPAAKGKAGKKAGKAPAKGLNELMQEDVVPMLSAELEKENVTDVELVWENNELRGCFVNGGVPYCFWAFFPDGKIEGSRGFSLTSHGYPPSTIEPFFDGEKPQTMSADMMVFWIKKRLFAQKSALPKLN